MTENYLQLIRNGKRIIVIYQFAHCTITLLNKPITKEDFASIDVSFKAFNQSHQKKVVGLFPSIFEIIKGKGGYIKSSSFETGLPEEIEEKDVGTIIEGAKKQVTIKKEMINNQK